MSLTDGRTDGQNYTAYAAFNASRVKLAATLRLFTAGGAIRIALRQLLQNRK